MKKVFFLFISVFFIVNKTVSQSQDRVITTAVPFLLIASDARAGGMGEQGVATSPDAFSQHWNPAKYAFSRHKVGVGASYTPYLSDLVNDIALMNLSFYNKISERSAWAASVRYFSLGDIEIISFDEAQIEGFRPLIERPNELTIDASYSLKLNETFSMAVAGRFLRSDLKIQSVDGNIDAGAASSFAVDVAGYYQSAEMAVGGINGRLRGGFNISNIGPKIKYEEGGVESFLPTNLKIGGGYEFIFDAYNTLSASLEFNKLLVPTPQEIEDFNNDGEIDGQDRQIATVDYNNIGFFSGMFKSFGDAPDGFGEEMKEFTWSLGLEYWYQDSFALRTGYFNESEEKGARKFFTLGAGFKFKAATIDMSYLFSASKVRNPLENTLRFSLTFNFGEMYSEY